MAGEFARAAEAITRLNELAMTRSSRMAEAKVREEAAKRKTTVEMRKKLDVEATAKVDLNIEDLRIKKDWKQMDELSSTIQGVTNEKSWKQARKFITEDQAERFNLKLNKPWKSNKSQAKYFLDRSVHTLKQQQALELAGVTAAAKAKTPKYKPPGKARLPETGQLSGIQTLLYTDPVFADMGKDDFTMSSHMVGIKFEDFKQVNEAKNNQRAANNLPAIAFNQSKAMALATQQTKEYLYEGIDTDWYKFGMGDPELKYLTPEKAQEREREWKQRFIQTRAQRDPTFLVELQTNPYKTDARMKAIYQKEQALRMRQDEAKLHSQINSR